MKRNRESLADQVVTEFLEEISDGTFSYGEKLPSHDKLAEHFEVSRIVVREALNKLSVIGIIRFHQGKGTYVKPEESMVSFPENIMQFTFNSEKNILFILETRRTIEKEICTLASVRRDENNCKKMRELLNLMNESKDNFEEYSRYDLEFHLEIARASKNPVFVQLLYMIKDLYMKYIATIFNIKGIIIESSKAHEDIFHAIEDKDPIKSSKIMEEHIEIVEEVLRKEIKSKKTN